MNSSEVLREPLPDLPPHRLDERRLLADKLLKDRHLCLKKKKGQHGDRTTIELIWFDPGAYLHWLHQHFGWMYTRWFTAFGALSIITMFVLVGAHWTEFWGDTLQYYNLTSKGLLDVLEFFAIFTFLGFVHETAHGLTCTHFGGRSQRMGVFLIYMAPGVFCDVTQVFVYGGRWARIMTAASGVWAEIVFVSWLSWVWWFT